MDSRKLQEHLARIGRRQPTRWGVTARQAAFVEALARDGHDPATAAKLQQAREEMEALHNGAGSRAAEEPGQSSRPRASGAR
jgi:hypothetical protein